MPVCDGNLLTSVARAIAWAVAIFAALSTSPAAPTLALAATFLEAEVEARNDPSVLFFTPVCNAQLVGHIVGPSEKSANGKGVRDGDSMAIVEALRAFEAKAEAEGSKPAEGKFYALCLDSGGGDLDEAMKIAALFKGWMMVVEDGAECISACSVIFMSAAARDRVSGYSDKSPGRFLHYNGLLGFHSPSLNFPASKAAGFTPLQSAKRAEKAYADALASMRSVAFPSRLGAPEESKSKNPPKVPAGVSMADFILTPLDLPKSVQIIEQIATTWIWWPILALAWKRIGDLGHGLDLFVPMVCASVLEIGPELAGRKEAAETVSYICIVLLIVLGVLKGTRFIAHTA